MPCGASAGRRLLAYWLGMGCFWGIGRMERGRAFVVGGSLVVGGGSKVEIVLPWQGQIWRCHIWWLIYRIVFLLVYVKVFGVYRRVTKKAGFVWGVDRKALRGKRRGRLMDEFV